MNQKPFWSLNHFTLPVAIIYFLTSMLRLDRSNPDSGNGSRTIK